MLCKAHKGLTPQRVNSCKTLICSQQQTSLGIESAQHLAGLDTEAAFVRTHVTSGGGVTNCAQCFTIKYTQSQYCF